MSGTDAIDRLIHEPTRLMLVSALYVVDEADFVHLAAKTGFTAGNISSHMAKLEAAGYVEISKGYADRRPRTTYRLTAVGRRAFAAYRTQVSNLLASNSFR